MSEYAFDVKLAAVARVQALSEAEARKRLSMVLEATTYSMALIDNVCITEVSLDDASGPYLFEIDGTDVERP